MIFKMHMVSVILCIYYEIVFHVDYYICYILMEFSIPRILVIENKIYTNHRYTFKHVYQSLSKHWILEFDHILGIGCLLPMFFKIDKPYISKFINRCAICISEYNHTLGLGVWLYIGSQIWSFMYLEVNQYIWIFDYHFIF